MFGHIHAGRGVEPIEWDRAQMAYENICAGRTGWGGLVKLLWYMAVEVVLSGGWCLYCLGQRRSGGGPEGWPEDCYGNLRITVMMHPLSIWPDHDFTVGWVGFFSDVYNLSVAINVSVETINDKLLQSSYQLLS